MLLAAIVFGATQIQDSRYHQDARDRENALALTNLRVENARQIRSTVDVQARQFSGFDLFKQQLAAVDMRGANLIFANMYASGLTSANLEDTQLARADMTLVVGDSANMANADMQFVRAVAAYLVHADLSGSRLWYADFEGACLVHTNFSNVTSFDTANFKAAIFSTSTVLPDGATMQDVLSRGAVLATGPDDVSLCFDYRRNFLLAGALRACHDSGRTWECKWDWPMNPLASA